MSNTSENTIFISGLSIQANTEDKVVILGLIDNMDSDNRKTYNFALPKMLVEKLIVGLNHVGQDFELNLDNYESTKEE